MLYLGFRFHEGELVMRFVKSTSFSFRLTVFFMPMPFQLESSDKQTLSHLTLSCFVMRGCQDSCTDL